MSSASEGPVFIPLGDQRNLLCLEILDLVVIRSLAGLCKCWRPLELLRARIARISDSFLESHCMYF